MGVVKAKNRAKAQEKGTVNPWLNVILMGMTSLLLMIIFYNPVTEFQTHDDYPPIISLTPQRVIEFGGTPATVITGMYIRDFPEFDMVKGIFVVDATVWFRFNPQLISLDRVSEFTFEKAEIVHKSEPYTRIDGKNLFARFDMRLKFNMPFNYSSFPLDDHRLNFTLANHFLSPSDAVFATSRSNLIVSPEIQVDGWDYVDKQIKTGYSEDKLDPNDVQQNVYHPRVIFSIDYERAGIRHIVSIFLPLLVIFFIALFSFSLNPITATVYNIVAMSSAAVTALIAYRFVIENMSPNVGYFMISDFIFIYFLLATSVILFVNVFGFKSSTRIKQLVMLALYALTALVFSYLLAPWI